MGHVTYSGDFSNVLIDIDTSGSGTPNAETWTDSQGNFLYKPTNLSYGPVSIEARVKVWNSQTNSYNAQPWQSVSFNYEQEPNSAGIACVAGTGRYQRHAASRASFDQPTRHRRKSDLSGRLARRDNSVRHQW